MLYVLAGEVAVACKTTDVRCGAEAHAGFNSHRRLSSETLANTSY